MTKPSVKESNDSGDYKAAVAELLSHYEDGPNLFKKAQAAKDWDYPVVIKEDSKDIPGLPTTWLALTERVLAIVAEQKYDLSYYPNTIEVITSEQMLDSYASVGMPVSYEHWSFGKQRIMEDKSYKAGASGLAYEIVINTDPAIAYCMENNSPLMQMLVIAHASFGHNNFFKENDNFKNFTNASTIVDDLREMRDFIHDCEEKYGYEEVEKVLDACHALEHFAVDRYNKRKKTDEQRKKAVEAKKAAQMERFSKPAENELYGTVRAKKDFGGVNDNKKPYSASMEENLMQYVAENAPHLEPWKRKIMNMVANKARYFHPQPRTQVMNEGWASFWHWTLLHDMRDLDLIDDGMMMEFIESHSGVLFQPDFDAQVMVAGPDGRPVIDPQTGQPKTRSIYSGINPYALGFAMFQDIKRICMEPTEEDQKWFPNFAGNGDWLNTLKHAMRHFDNESFILQYLSPKVMRDFTLFSTEDNADNDYVEIRGIHDSQGYERVRKDLSMQYNLDLMLPRIEVAEYHARTDRHIVLQHTIRNNKPLYEKDTLEVMKHIYQMWGHPVVLRSVDEDGSVKKTLSIPPDYKEPKNAPTPKI